MLRGLLNQKVKIKQIALVVRLSPKELNLEYIEMKDKIAVITGANSGIGLASTKNLVGQGAKVVMVCRSETKGQQAISEIKNQHPQAEIDLVLADLAEPASIREAGLHIREKYNKIDVLLNNAGGTFGKHRLNSAGWEYTFALDHMGYFLFTHYLLDLVKAGDMKRIVNVSSEAHRFVKEIKWDQLQAEAGYSEIQAYGIAKLFNIYFSQKLAELSAANGITVNSLHPGVVKTNFGQEAGFLFKLLLPIFGLFALSPEKGAATSIYLASSPKAEGLSGLYFDKKKPKEISELAKSTEQRDKLWEYSLELAGIESYGEV